MTTDKPIQFKDDMEERGYFLQFLLNYVQQTPAPYFPVATAQKTLSFPSSPEDLDGRTKEDTSSYRGLLPPTMAIELMTHGLLVPKSEKQGMDRTRAEGTAYGVDAEGYRRLQSVSMMKNPDYELIEHIPPTHYRRDTFSEVPSYSMLSMYYLQPTGRKLENTLPESFKLLTALVKMNGAPVTRGYMETRVAPYDFDFEYFASMFLTYVPGNRWSLNALGTSFGIHLYDYLNTSDPELRPWSPMIHPRHNHPQPGPALKYKHSRAIMCILGDLRTVVPVTREDLATLLNMKNNIQALDNSLDYLVKEGYVATIQTKGRPFYYLSGKGTVSYSLFMVNL